MPAECASCARRKAQSLNDFPSLSLLLPEISPNCLHKQPHADCWGSQQGGSEWSQDVETGGKEGWIRVVTLQKNKQMMPLHDV